MRPSFQRSGPSGLGKRGATRRQTILRALATMGATDRVVSVAPSRRLHEALRTAGRAVEYVKVARASHADGNDEEEQGLLARYVALFSRALA